MVQEQPVPGHNKYFSILQRHLEQGAYDLAACGPTTPTVEEIAAFAAEAQVQLPFDFVDFSVSQIGGVYISVKESIWPPLKAGDVGPFWTMLNGLWVYGFAADAPPALDIRLQTRRFREESKTNLTPCLKIIHDANVYCFDPEGNMCRWDHDTGDSPKVNRSFLEVLDFELGELASRKKRYVELKSPKKKWWPFGRK